MAGQQLKVLNALDVVKTQWYHFTAIVIAGMGFFADAFDLFCIPLVTKLLGHIYYHEEGSKTPDFLPANVAAAVNGVAFCGTLAGQLFFGWLGDKMGFGIGGDYPLSATIMSEYANRKTRGAFIAAVFAMQGFGILTGGMAAIIVSAAFKAIYPASTYAMDFLKLIMLGAASDMAKVFQVDLEAEEQKVEQITQDKIVYLLLTTLAFILA
ncbi:hypothetical protein EZV62_000942 [Acer yangbiense]|uniref:Major facilitator superfamily (MFS) profile domain-containing protein n=1 Tax=Acer yangbiense TaxID=1000413 RepID=A0A5C7ISJ1_9ROSI|nr:hypothetical protein EZV62_000942 [Acer yangbiense]